MAAGGGEKDLATLAKQDIDAELLLRQVATLIGRCNYFSVSLYRILAVSAPHH